MPSFTATTHEAVTIARAGMGGTVAIVRRLKVQPDQTSDPSGQGEWGALNRYGYWAPVRDIQPLSPGKPVWVKEVFSYEKLDVDHVGFMPLWYWADGNPDSGDYERPKPAITMPRWASRFTLTPQTVRVCRVSDMSVDEVIAADCAAWDRNNWVMVALCKIGGVE